MHCNQYALNTHWAVLFWDWVHLSQPALRQHSTITTHKILVKKVKLR